MHQHVRRHVYHLLAVSLAAVLLGGCATDMPSANNPVCSWEKSVPDNGDAICRETFHTVNALVRAQVHDDTATIHRLVVTPRVGSRIINHGRSIRAQHISRYHVLPSIILDLPVKGVVGASVELRGKKLSGSTYSNTETVYMHIRNGTAYVFDDQALENW